MSSPKKVLLSGVKPTGAPHIGNYFGALKQFVDLQDQYQSYVMVADYHALNFIQQADEMRELTYNLVLDYLAIGLDPKKVTLFQQSTISEHTELAWIFDTLTTMPYLMRAHAFKDAEAKKKEVSVGTFNYPMLMAADILLYEPDVVPVGQDQKQHVEYARDTAEKFNRTFGETFKLPTEYIIKEVAIVPGTDGQKMSKSYGNTIPLFADDKTIVDAAMSIKTDSKGTNEPKDPETCNIFALHKLVSQNELEELRSRYIKGEIGYKESKEILIKNLQSFIGPMRQKREAVKNDRPYVLGVLEEGRVKAKEIASNKMESIRERIGVTLR